MFNVCIRYWHCRIIADQYIVITVSSTFTMEEFKSANFSTVAYHIIDRVSMKWISSMNDTDASIVDTCLILLAHDVRRDFPPLV